MAAGDRTPSGASSLLLNRRVSTIDPAARTVSLDDGSRREFGALLIATGADPVRLPIPGADGSQVFYLRSLADSRAIIEPATSAKHVVVVGASFIGLEVAASLRTRDIAVDVVAPETRAARARHGGGGRAVHSFAARVDKGVRFHLEQTVACGRRAAPSRSAAAATIDADLLVVGVGCQAGRRRWPSEPGLTLDRGIAVNEFLETSAPGIFAAGDVARWPDPHTGRAHPSRALGGRRASGSGCGAQHAGPPRAVRRGAVFLEPALRRHDPLRRPRRKMGCRPDRRQPGRARLRGHLHARRSTAGRGDGVARSRESRSGGQLERV